MDLKTIMTPELTIPLEAWRPVGGEQDEESLECGNPWSILATTLKVNGLTLYLTAYEVLPSEESDTEIQQMRPHDPETWLDFQSAFSADEFENLVIGDRAYTVFASAAKPYRFEYKGHHKEPFQSLH